MPGINDIKWFKTTFWSDITAALAGSALDADMLVAVACQETGELWSAMRTTTLDKAAIVRLCCGDTLDADKGRKAFPKTKADLIAVKDGQAMFDIARAALLGMAAHVPGYGFAKNKPDKFCHGFGVFQYDLQFFKTDPQYFLQKKYEIFENSLGRAIGELHGAIKKRGLEGKAALTDAEFLTVAITYNTGGYKAALKLKQGHFDGTKYYGESVRDYLALARGISPPNAVGPAVEPIAGTASVAPPTVALTATGPQYRVETKLTTLRLRSEPKISKPVTKNVLADLPDGWEVRAVSGVSVNGFMEIETVLNGAMFRGFSSTDFLVKIAAAPSVADAATPAPAPTAPGTPAEKAIPAVWMPRKTGTITKRSEIAGAHSLNEAGMPGRLSKTPDGLRKDLYAIVTYLDPEKAAHKRYQPRKKLTFCNIYAHDYCALAGVYLPRVWWKDTAIKEIEAGKTLEPLYEKTIQEMRANDLFRWLQTYGDMHGWVRATTTNAVQEAANLGAVALIIARRKDDGLSGHVTMVVPEMGDLTARNAADGTITAPLQSQAGATNFNFGNGTTRWWTHERFADSGFWYHA